MRGEGARQSCGLKIRNSAICICCEVEQTGVSPTVFFLLLSNKQTAESKEKVGRSSRGKKVTIAVSQTLKAQLCSSSSFDRIPVRVKKD